jgi:FkbM family methyltransferase
MYFFNLLQEGRRLLWRANKDKVYDIKVFADYKFKFIGFGFITEKLYTLQSQVYDNKGFEHETLKKYTELLKSGDTVLDIGANVGLFSFLGSAIVGDKGTIHAFEPSKNTFDALNSNIKLNGLSNVQPHQLALSNENGTISMGDAADDALNFIDINQANKNGEIVKMQTLDSFLKNNNINKVDFIKIDIEGAEFFCFKGAIEMFKSHPPIIIMECNENWCKRFGYSVFELLTFLNGFGYRFEQYDEAQWLAFPPIKNKN